MKKKIILGASILALAIPTFVFANSDIRLWMKGEIIKSDVAPYISEDRTMVPLRVISENLGKKVTWNNNDKKVNIKDEKGNEFSLVINEKFMENVSSDSNLKIKLDAPAVIKDNRTFVPIRAIAEAFGEKVQWDNDKRVVVIGDNYDSKNIKNDEIEKSEDPLGLDYLYKKDMAGKSDEEKSNYEKRMREMPSKVFKGYKNGEVEACLAWLSFAKAGEFFEADLNKNPFLNPYKDGFDIGPTERGESISSFDDYEKDEKYTREIMGVSSGPSMAMLEHFDYYLNFDGTFNYFRLPLHYHSDAPEMLKEVKDIVSKPKKVKFIKADKKDVEKLLRILGGMSYNPYK
ncbi:copper amine oxidase N-terminal domain-containing protein [uncultured Peptoniphilus sp.]|uniref:Copper amine oxidase-like N-terminal domain-containing protein n=1 Tax=Peptoniphilus gorbachii TaxID=411567 RepID=A0A6N3BEL9_9FIRM|nr:copper amine oxidase N-terminal domain-containing protein [uncultured Peptoniphilus sp.]MDU3009607.1 copper amine oxidase N-terminal domain-containing protein [Peptoniphilus harei]